MGRWKSLSRLSILALATACGSAYADRIAVPPEPGPVAPVVAESPYKVELLAENGGTLPVYQQGGRFYIQGAVGQRYTIRVTNPTARRVEAVVSVDGLDVIDGKTADFRGKRGYVVPAYGELRVEGWRVSTTQVAAFRFSSVSGSYAGRKGQPRNVGVVGVAIFEEKAQPEIIVQQPPPPPYYRDRWVDYDEKDGDDWGGEATGNAERRAPADKAPAKPAPPPAEPPRGGATGGRGDATAGAPPVPTTEDGRYCCTKHEERPGLGTEWGEQRWSAVSWTRFERANPSVPSALAEFRYNDAAGLAALGIRTTPVVSPGEIETRESASPFPGSGFASPPPAR